MRGLEQAVKNGWYEFKKFDYKLYENYHKLDVGDMNWVIPGKILAFSSPTAEKSDGLSPESFLENFQKMNVKAVVRLNDPLYNAKVFEKQGIKVHDLEFEDGSCPSDVSSTGFLYHTNRMLSNTSLSFVISTLSPRGQ